MLFSFQQTVSAGVSYEGKGRLHFIDEKAKVNANYYVENLLPKLVDDCHTVLGNQFNFQQDGAPTHGAKLAQDWLTSHCPDFIDKIHGRQIPQIRTNSTMLSGMQCLRPATNLAQCQRTFLS